MQTYRTNTYDDDYRHVCARDLDNYVQKNELVYQLEQSSDIEKEHIKAWLDIPEDSKVDHYLDPRSYNAVDNRSVSEALMGKVDKDRLAKVAVTGSYYHLKDAPQELPNPEVLVIKDQNGHPFVYDGSRSTIVEMPTSITDFKDWKQYYIPIQDIENLIPIKHIYINGKEIFPDDCKQVLIQTITSDDVEEKLKYYESKAEFQQEKNDLIHRINNKVEKADFNSLNSKVNTLERSQNLVALTEEEIKEITSK